MDPLKYLTSRSTCPGPRQSDLLLRRKLSMSKHLYSKDLVGHFGCVNALEFSHGLGNHLASGGDDRRVLLWDIEKAISDIGKPSVMKGEHNSNIFCLAFDVTNTTLFSGGNDEQVIVHDIATGITKDVFLHDDAVYGLSPDPTNPHVFASSCDDGRVLIYDIRDSAGDPFCLANYTSSMHSVMYNPVEPRLLATANAKEGVGLWDVRKPRSCVLRYGGSLVQQSCMSVRWNQHGDQIASCTLQETYCVLRYGGSLVQQSCMSVRWNQHGDQIIALRRRLPPVLYKIHSNVPVCEFDHSGYYNSCTMKSVAFAGDLDQYVISGSDEFNLYMWAVPEDLSERAYVNSAHMVLKGHRSIVNQVRFNPSNHLIVSSGVEKIVKAWSPFKFPNKHTGEGETEGGSKTARGRSVYSHEEYINLVLENGHVMSHDYSHRSTEEDPRMIAFFDSLVQRELEGLSSDDSLSSNEEALYSRIIQLSQSDIDSDDSLLGTGDHNSDGEPNFSPFTIAFASVMASQAAEGNDRYPRLNSAVNSREARQDSESTEHGNTVHTDTSRPDRDRATCDISKMVLKKKLELRHSIQKKLKDSSAKLSDISSAESTDISDLELSDTEEKLHAKIDKDEIDPEIEKSISETSRCLLEKLHECKKQSQVKLRRLKNLRQSVLNSESDDSESESKHKHRQIECLTSTPAGSVNNNNMGDTGEKVKFKKFRRRRNSDTVGSDDRDIAKSKASPDFGPYLQKAGTSSVNSEARKSSDETSTKRGKKYLPEESLTGKGKLKSSNKKLSHSKDSSQKSRDFESLSDSRLKCNDSKTKNENERTSHLSQNTSDNCVSKHGSDGEQETHRLKGKIIEDKSRKFKRHRSVSPTYNRSSHTGKRSFEDWDRNDHNNKYTKFDNSHKSSSISHMNDHKVNMDSERPSCSYRDDRHIGRSRSEKSDASPQHKRTSDSEEDTLSTEQDDRNENDQPTWSEFKRFKNRLERARHRYKEHKKLKNQRRYSDDK